MDDDLRRRSSLPAKNETKKKNNKTGTVAVAATGAAAAGVGAGVWMARRSAPPSTTAATAVSRDGPRPSLQIDTQPDVEEPDDIDDDEPRLVLNSTSITAQDSTLMEDDEEGATTPVHNKDKSCRKSSSWGAASKDGEAGKNDEGGVTPTSTVQHSFQSAPSRSIAGMSRPVLGGVALLAAGAVALGVWTGVRVPELNTQVNDLEDQVNRLEVQRKRLQVENDRFETSNDILNASIARFRRQNEILRETSAFLNASVYELEAQIDELEIVNDELRNITDDIGAQNDILDATNQLLADDVAELRDYVTDLDARYEELIVIQRDLESNVTFFEQENDQLNKMALELEQLQLVAEQENDELQANLIELDTITTWLNASVQGTDEELAVAANDLSASIAENRFFGIEATHLEYQDFLHGWDCLMSDLYPPQFSNPTALIDAAPLADMLNYMSTDTGLVTLICLDDADYRLYLDTRFDTTTPNITTRQYVLGTNAYGLAALAYMFPNDPANGGLSPADWEAADYNCDNITQFAFATSSLATTV